MKFTCPQIAFVGNPVFVSVSDLVAEDKVNLTVSSAGKITTLVAEADKLGMVRFNIAEILSAHIVNYPDNILTNLEQRDAKNSVVLLMINGRLSFAQAIAAFSGGIPKPVFRKLTEQRTNIFAEKLQNYTGNCFLTTRTDGDSVSIPIDEISSLCFIGNDAAHTFSVVNDTTGKIYDIAIPAGTKRNYVSLPLALLALEISKKGNITIKIDGNNCLKIKITEPTPGNERYILTFQNSYGAYELIEVTGRAVSEPEYSEDSIYSIYEPITDSLRNKKLRKEFTEVLKVECGYRTKDRLLFIRDMLISEDVKLQGADGEWIDVLVSADEDSIPKIMTEPTSIPLTIKFAESDSRYSVTEQINTLPEDITLLAYDNGTLVQTDNNELIKL